MHKNDEAKKDSVKRAFLLNALKTFSVGEMYNAWNEYTVALCLMSTETLKPLTVGINIFNGYNMIEWQYLFSASLFAILPVVIMFMCIEKNLVSGLAAGGVKG